MDRGGVAYLRKHGNNRYHRIRTVVERGGAGPARISLPFVMEMFGHALLLQLSLAAQDRILLSADDFAASALIILYSFIGSLVMVPLLGLFRQALVLLLGVRVRWAGQHGRRPLASPHQQVHASWRFEQVTVHPTLVLAIMTTVLVSANFPVASDRLSPSRASSVASTASWSAPSWRGSVGRRASIHPRCRACGVATSVRWPRSWAPAEGGRYPHPGEAGHVHLLRQLQHLSARWGSTCARTRSATRASRARAASAAACARTSARVACSSSKTSAPHRARRPSSVCR